MPHCVNCGHEVTEGAGLCRCCYRDPAIPEMYWGQVLEEVEANPDKTDNLPDFSYRHEKLALVISIIITVILIATIATVSFGVALLGLLVSLIIYRYNRRRTRARLLKVTPQDFPLVYRLTRLAAVRLRVPVPPVFIQQSPVLNAYTTGFFDDNWVVLHSALVEKLEPGELLFVIGHELGHIRLRHVTWLTFVSPTHEAIRVPFLSAVLRPIFNNWHLRSEYSADRGGLIAANDVHAAVMAEIRLLADGAIKKDFNYEAFLNGVLAETDQLYDDFFELLFDTHPLGRKRIRQIVAFSGSDEFKRISEEYLRIRVSSI